MNGAPIHTSETEQSLIRVRILECEVRMRDQREGMARMAAVGADISSAINLLSAMESSQALRFRRLAALS
jgi:hypothetical protein